MKYQKWNTLQKNYRIIHTYISISLFRAATRLFKTNAS